MKILVVEDEAALRAGLTDLLRASGHTVEAVEDGESALARGVDSSIEMLLLDLMLPGIDGIEVCRRLRVHRPDLPILMLTARGSEDDTVAGLESGADDYLTKPFGTRELLARVEALGRRRQQRVAATSLEADGCRLDLGRCRAVRPGVPTIPLTAREASILRCLHLNRERAVSRAELLERIWGSRGDLQTRTVDMTIANLRQKIERDASDPKIVVTVKGVGYAWGET